MGAALASIRQNSQARITRPCGCGCGVLITRHQSLDGVARWFVNPEHKRRAPSWQHVKGKP